MDMKKGRVTGIARRAKALLGVAIVFALLLAACGDSGTSATTTSDERLYTQEEVDALIEEAVASATASTEPPDTTTSSSTTPSSTTTTAAATTTTVDRAEAIETFRVAMISDLETGGDIERVDVLTFEDGQLVLEAHSRWASEDRQAATSWDAIGYLAELFTTTDAATLTGLFGTPEPQFVVRTVSTDGDYPHESTTSYADLVRVANRTVGYDEWAVAAGFR